MIKNRRVNKNEIMYNKIYDNELAFLDPVNKKPLLPEVFEPPVFVSKLRAN